MSEKSQILKKYSEAIEREEKASKEIEDISSIRSYFIVVGRKIEVTLKNGSYDSDIPIIESNQFTSEEKEEFFSFIKVFFDKKFKSNLKINKDKYTEMLVKNL